MVVHADPVVGARRSHRRHLSARELLVRGDVYFRDIEHLIGVVLQAWFWVVPIIYSYNLVYGLFKRHHIIYWMGVYLADPVTPIILCSSERSTERCR